MKLAVLGSPITHSQSPALHRAAYNALDLDWSYEALDVSSPALAPFIASRGQEWRGLSLTMPLKRDVVELIDEQDENSRITGAANTVLFRDVAGVRRLHGFNTDVYGIQRALESASINSVDRVKLLGAGATAASVIVAAHRMGARFIELSARSPRTAAPLAELMTTLHLDFTIAEFSAQSSRGLPDVVISTVPGGAVFEQNFTAELRRSVPLFDIAYDPWPSSLARTWGEAGGTVISGIEMLLHQALLQVRIFVNGSADEALNDEEAVFSAMRASVGIAART